MFFGRSEPPFNCKEAVPYCKSAADHGEIDAHFESKSG